MKKITTLLALLMAFQYAQSQRLMYCPRALYGSVPPNVPVEVLSTDNFSTLNGDYLILNPRYAEFSSTFKCAYVLNETAYCTQSEVVENNRRFRLPSGLQGNVQTGNPYTAYLIDSTGKGWVPTRDNDGYINGYNSISAGKGQYFVRVLHDRFITNKNRIYSNAGDSLVFHFAIGIGPEDVVEISRNWFVFDDSLIVKFQDTASNGNFYRSDTVIVPNGPVVYTDRLLSRVATPFHILEFDNNQWKSLFSVDSNRHKGYVIKRFNPKYVLLHNAESGEWLNVDYNNVEVQVDYGQLKFARRVPDSLFQDLNGKFVILAGGNVHRLRYSLDEYYRNYGSVPSNMVTSLNDRLFSVRNDSILTKSDSLSPWKPWMEIPAGIKQITYNNQGNIILVGSKAHYVVDPASQDIDTIPYPCNAISFRHFDGNNGMVLTCSDTTYLNDSLHRWRKLGNIKGLRSIAFSNQLVVAIDNEGFKWAPIDSLQFSLLKIENRHTTFGFLPKRMIKPKMVNMYGSDKMFFLFNEAEHSNILFSINDTSNTLEVKSSLEMIREQRHHFFDYDYEYETGMLPFKTRCIAHSRNSLTILTDAGLVRFDCTGSVDPEPKLEATVYPNPAHDQVSFNMECQYTIFDLQGRQVLSGIGSTVHINELPRALYVVQLRANNETAYAKFIKE